MAIDQVYNSELHSSIRAKLNALIQQANELPEAARIMQDLLYDPRGIGADTFDLSNKTGVLDGGTFT